MKIWTASWFTKLPPEILRVGISRGTPRGQPGGYKMLPELRPGDWFRDCAPPEYVRRYYGEVLAKIDPTQTIAKLEELGQGRDVALLCFERPRFDIRTGNYCHRRLSASALEQAMPGVAIEEYLLPDQEIGDTVPLAATFDDWLQLAIDRTPTGNLFNR